jgi:MFS transporter, DHA2 family, multidrug resistance protein
VWTACQPRTDGSTLGAAVGLLALLRNEGGSVGTSVAQTIHERRDQLHSLHLGENLDKLNPAVKSFLEQAQAGFLQLTGDPGAARRIPSPRGLGMKIQA